jgi:hypothetical protein
MLLGAVALGIALPLASHCLWRRCHVRRSGACRRHPRRMQNADDVQLGRLSAELQGRRFGLGQRGRYRDRRYPWDSMNSRAGDSSAARPSCWIPAVVQSTLIREPAIRNTESIFEIFMVDTNTLLPKPVLVAKRWPLELSTPLRSFCFPFGPITHRSDATGTLCKAVPSLGSDIAFWRSELQPFDPLGKWSASRESAINLRIDQNSAPIFCGL